MKRYSKLALSLGLFLLPGLPLHKRDNSRERIALILQTEAVRLNEETRHQITETVLHLSQEYRIDPMLILAVMKVESEFDLKARSRAGAIGLMQVMPIAARETAKDLEVTSLHSPQSNIRIGVHYLAGLMKRFKGDLIKALMAYNRGPTQVARAYKNRRAPLGGYQNKVLRVYREFLNS